jgi:hypothetical protein
LKRTAFPTAVVVSSIFLLGVATAMYGFRAETTISRIEFSQAGARCDDCEAAQVVLGQAIAYAPSGWKIPFVCTDSLMRFSIKGAQYFTGPGHITVGLSGEISPRTNEFPGRLFGRGIVLGQTGAYPDSRGCPDGPRAQIESYWPRDFNIPSELLLPYSATPGKKGNELFPESCSSQKLRDEEVYKVSVSVNCSLEQVRYSIESANAGCEERVVLDSSLSGVKVGDVNTERAANVSGWWVGHVFASEAAPWRVELTNLKLVKETYLSLPGFQLDLLRASSGPLCTTTKI